MKQGNLKWLSISSRILSFHQFETSKEFEEVLILYTLLFRLNHETTFINRGNIFSWSERASWRILWLLLQFFNVTEFLKWLYNYDPSSHSHHRCIYLHIFHLMKNIHLKDYIFHHLKNRFIVFCKEENLRENVLSKQTNTIKTTNLQPSMNYSICSANFVHMRRLVFLFFTLLAISLILRTMVCARNVSYNINIFFHQSNLWQYRLYEV